MVSGSDKLVRLKDVKDSISSNRGAQIVHDVNWNRDTHKISAWIFLSLTRSMNLLTVYMKLLKIVGLG